MKAELLRLLRNSTDYISGQELCEKFGVSRTAIWKLIGQLREEGYDIEAVTNKGYRLVSYPQVFNAVELMSRMNTEWIGKKVYFREETESTNTDAKNLADAGAGNGTLVVADTQTGGKGRRGRSWYSPVGSSISFSLLLRPEISPQCAPMLTLVMGVAVAEVLHNLYRDMDVRIKWPNDVLINDKKVCGILTEMNAEMDYIHDVVIGVGINVNQDEFPEEVSEIATSLRMVTGEKQERTPIVVGVMEFFEYYYGLFEKQQDLSAFVDIYDSYLINRKREVCVLDPKGSYKGIAEGINDRGELIIRMPDKSIRRVSSGEVSVRGVYGYV